jgi:hypothetical protein
MRGAPEASLPSMSLLNVITLLSHLSNLVGETPYHSRFTKGRRVSQLPLGL